MSPFDTAIHNLAQDISNKTLTTDQLAHTCQAISDAYGPKPSDIADLASSLAMTWAWDKLPDKQHTITLH